MASPQSREVTPRAASSSLNFLMLGSLFSCTNLNKQDKLLTLEGECSQAGNISKQCEIINLKGLTITEKENLMGWIYLWLCFHSQPLKLLYYRLLVGILLLR